jgi:uncharacterized protein YeeX (DUF496 family)
MKPMLFVEDGLKVLIEYYKCSNDDEWRSNFLKNMKNYIESDRPLSTEQSKVILKMLKKISNTLVQKNIVQKSDLADLLNEPQFRMEPYPSKNIKKFRELVIFNETRRKIYFNYDYSLWIVPVVVETILPIRDIISVHRFNMDETVRDYLILCENNRRKASTCVADTQNNVFVINVHNNKGLASWIEEVAGGKIL